jgi:hypothetical protein
MNVSASFEENLALMELIPLINFFVSQGKDWIHELSGVEKGIFHKIKITAPPQLRGTPYEGRIYLLKYAETNRIWTISTRQCRGTIIFLNDAGKWEPIRFMFLRGSELLTGFHISNGVSQTQDIGSPDVKHISVSNLDKSQQDLIQLLQTPNAPLSDTFLSMKADGSLLCVTVYTGAVANVVRTIIATSGDEFTKFSLEMERRTGKLIVLSTQGTMMMHSDMHSYVTTSILSTWFSDDKIRQLASDMDYLTAYKTSCARFFDEIARMFDTCPKKKTETSITFCFEAIVEKRTCAWGVVSRELAVSYPKSVLKFLGVGICDGDKLISYPHYAVPEGVNGVFEEPPFWRVDNSDKVNVMTETLNKISLGELPQETFFERFPYANHSRVSRFLDYEGFVIYVNGQGNKIKTRVYYDAHSEDRFKTENIDMLLRLATVAGDIFPLARKVADLLTECKTKMPVLLSAIYAELNMGTNSPFFTDMNDKTKAAFAKQTKPSVQWMMMFNQGKIADEESSRALYYKIFQQQPPSVVEMTFRDFCYYMFCATFPQLKDVTDVKMYVSKIVETHIIKKDVFTPTDIVRDLDMILSAENQYLAKLFSCMV